VHATGRSGEQQAGEIHARDEEDEARDGEDCDKRRRERTPQLQIDAGCRRLEEWPRLQETLALWANVGCGDGIPQ
jgi:hypothetical protein